MPVTVRLCWTAQATASGHQGHCGRCKPQSHWPSLRQRGVGAGARGRSNPLAGARGRTARMTRRRAGKPVSKARGQPADSAQRSVRTICLLERADTPLAETRTRSARRQAIAFNGTRYGRLHEFHQISGGYGQTILLYAQARKREQYFE